MPETDKYKSRNLILVMALVVLTGVGIAWLYYSGENKSVDPRIKDARKLYEKYNQFASRSEYDSVLWLMDTIENIYQSVEHYHDSYETAVLLNNRAAVYLSIFLQPENDVLIGDTLVILSRAEKYLGESIKIYDSWLKDFRKLDEDEIRSKIEQDFLKGLAEYDDTQKQAFLEKRIEEISEAKIENERRLSVCYTNLGIIKRHQQKYDSAAEYYKMAIDLWDRNLTAENNLNILLNRPMKKRNLIQKLFPPEK